MARTREFDPDAALQVAIRLFWEKGYAETSVDEVVARSGVAKYGIYGTFGNKRELFFKALAQYERDRRADMQEPIRRPDAKLSDIREFFAKAPKLLLAKSCPGGCLINNTGIDFGNRDDEIHAFVKAFFRDLERVMKACLERAREYGEIAADADLTGLARYLVNEFRLVLMLARNGHSRRAIDDHLGFALEALT